MGQTIASPTRSCCSAAATLECTSAALPWEPALQGRGAGRVCVETCRQGGQFPFLRWGGEGSESPARADANPARRASLGANRAATAIPQPQGRPSSSRSRRSLKNTQPIHKYITSYSFSKDKILTRNMPTPARENSVLTGKADGPIFCPSLSLTCCVVSEHGVLAHKLQSLAQWTHTSRQPIPTSKLSDGSSPFWDTAQLRERQPRMVPMCYHHPLGLGTARAAWQQPTLRAATCSSQVPNFCPFPTCPPLQ